MLSLFASTFYMPTSMMLLEGRDEKEKKKEKLFQSGRKLYLTSFSCATVIVLVTKNLRPYAKNVKMTMAIFCVKHVMGCWWKCLRDRCEKNTRNDKEFKLRKKKFNLHLNGFRTINLQLRNRTLKNLVIIFICYNNLKLSTVISNYNQNSSKFSSPGQIPELSPPPQFSTSIFLR